MTEKTRISPQLRFEIVALYTEGNSVQTISDMTNLGRWVIGRVLKEHNVIMRSSGGVRAYDVRSNAFDDLTKELPAYWLGFLFADGATNKTNIQIALSGKDQSHLKKLANFLGIEGRIRTYRVKEGKYTVTALRFSDKSLAIKLRKLGIVSHRPNAEKIFDNIPGVSMNHFLRGFFDGDGSAYKHPQLCFVGRVKFLQRLQEVFIENCSAKEITIAVSKTNQNIGSLNYKGVYRCGAIAAYLYKDATIWLERKRKRIDNWPEPQRAKQASIWE